MCTIQLWTLESCASRTLTPYFVHLWFIMGPFKKMTTPDSSLMTNSGNSTTTSSTNWDSASSTASGNNASLSSAMNLNNFWSTQGYFGANTGFGAASPYGTTDFSHWPSQWNAADNRFPSKCFVLHCLLQDTIAGISQDISIEHANHVSHCKTELYPSVNISKELYIVHLLC